MIEKLPTLYKKTSGGAIQEWSCWADGPRVYTLSGQVDGRKVASEGTLCTGKNVGRSNETSPQAQADAEALSRWERKAKSGYCLTREEAEAGEVNTDYVPVDVPLAMLAHVYEKRGSAMNWPCLSQPKLDGIRVLAVVNADGSCSLWSRTRKPITGIPHVIEAIEALGLPTGTVLDGEAYEHGHRDRFEEIVSYVRQATPKAGHEIVQLHVYDLASHPGTFVERHAAVRRMIPRDHPTLVSVYTRELEDEEALADFMAEQLRRGYEGAILRSREGLYENKRSVGLLKVKTMLDEDFLVTGVQTGRGRMEGLAVFTCRTPAGKSFNVKMQGALADLRKYVDDPSLAVGRPLEVRFQNLTADGLPRFPVGVRFKDAV